MAPDEILLGKPYSDRDAGVVMFRLADLHQHLARRRLSIASNKLAVLLRDHGGESGGAKHMPRIKHKQVRVWTLPIELVDENTQSEPFEVPPMGEHEF